MVDRYKVKQAPFLYNLNMLTTFLNIYNAVLHHLDVHLQHGYDWEQWIVLLENAHIWEKEVSRTVHAPICLTFETESNDSNETLLSI